MIGAAATRMPHDPGLAAVAIWFLLQAVSPVAPPSARTALAPQEVAPEAVRREIQGRVELLRQSGRLEPAGEQIRMPIAVAEMYEAVSFQPLWNGPATDGLRRALAGLADDGLRPEDYHALHAGPSRESTAAGIAERDLLRTDALLLAAHDLRFGRARPAEDGATPPVSVAAATGVGVPVVVRMIRSPSLPEALGSFRPHHVAYRSLAAELAGLRRIRQAGGWEPIPSGPALRRDSADWRVPLLRRRLLVSGDLAAGPLRTDSVFDPALEAAVLSFQHRHGLAEDGVVGPATLAGLNVPVEGRIDQVRVNLERARWVLHELPDTALVVNIAGAMVYLVRGSEIAFQSRAIVGTPYTRTPVFTALLRYVELNPSWTVPPGIVGEILAHVRGSSTYLARQRIHVIDRSGRRVDPATIDFSAWGPRTFPYVFRQDPGPANPLGRVKFGLPNRYSVYLHDTPSRELFARDERTFSHGCIRVEDPFRLAELLLAGTSWSRQELETAVGSGKTVVIDLPEPVPVVVQYWTAAADLHGELHFYRDVYDRDRAVLERLNRP